MNRSRPTCLLAAALATLSLLVACSKASPPAVTAEAAPAKGSEKQGVTLTPEQIEKLGVTTQPAATAEYTQEALGYGLIVSHDSIAQAVSELEAAKVTARYSQAALARAEHLAGTPGSMSADAAESIAQKAAVDRAALTLTSQRLSAQFGMNPPWSRSDNGGMLERLASGQSKLLRATFPLGALVEGIPHSLRAQRITTSRSNKDWNTNIVWQAPADSSVPGRSFFALINNADAQEGERLQVWAPLAASLKGVVVPAAAVVMSDGRFWCYLERSGGSFTRVQIETNRLISDGYFVTEGIEAGDSIVTTSAGLLLAKELGAESESE